MGPSRMGCRASGDIASDITDSESSARQCPGPSSTARRQLNFNYLIKVSYTRGSHSSETQKGGRKRNKFKKRMKNQQNICSERWRWSELQRDNMLSGRRVRPSTWKQNTRKHHRETSMRKRNRKNILRGNTQRRCKQPDTPIAFSSCSI